MSKYLHKSPLSHICTNHSLLYLPHRHELALQALQSDDPELQQGAEESADNQLNMDGSMSQPQTPADLSTLQQQDIGHTTTIAQQDVVATTTIGQQDLQTNQVLSQEDLNGNSSLHQQLQQTFGQQVSCIFNFLIF